MGEDTTLGYSAGSEKVVRLKEKPKVDRPTLIILKGPVSGANFLLLGEQVSIGRDPDNDIFFNDVTVSRKHAEIIKNEKGFCIQDNRSLNGTYLNGERVENSLLKDGDCLQIGKYQLMFLTGE